MAHILLIEDDPDIASLLRRGLAAAGHSTEHTDCHAGAVQALAGRPFDAAIVDMMLGEESGAEILADLRAAGLDLHPDFVPWIGMVIRIAYEAAP